MPRVGFEAENKVATTNYDYPKLKLKKGEHARILILEDPVMEFVHTLRKPQIIAGVPQMTTATRKDESEYKTNKMDFISRPICLGDATILAEKGSDPKNCPMCKLAKEYPDFTKEPQQRYAMHVIRYRTKAGGTEVALPFGCEVLVWSFTGNRFNEIADAKTEWKDLRKHDLLLGPCTKEDFQTFNLNVAAQAAWLEDKERLNLVKAMWAQNQIPDLTIAVGSVKQRDWVQQDIEAIMEAWAQVNGAEVTYGDADLDASLDSLLSSPGEVATAVLDDAADPWATDESSDDLLAGLEDTSTGVEIDDADLDMSVGVPEVVAPVAAPKAPAAKPAAAKPAAPKAPKSAPAAAVAEPPVDNFDDLLADLG